MSLPAPVFLRAAVTVCCATFAGALSWTRNSIPLSGELVLTDVHAVLDVATNTIVALATGEGGVVLKLNATASLVPGGNWVTLLDTSYPTYWYGTFLFNSSAYLLSGFLDGSGKSCGVVSFSYDSGATWTNDTVIDVTNWGGGPIEFANATEGYMPSTSGASAWRTTTGGTTAAAWEEIVPSPGNWHAGDYVYDGDGLIAIAGSSDCNSTDFGVTWACGAPVDASGLDSALACSGDVCVVGGGEISPAVAGWTHVSTDGGRTWGAGRALNALFPIRSVLAVPSTPGLPPLLIAAGGNIYSNAGGMYSSSDGGRTWNLDASTGGEEVKACRALPLPLLGVTRVWCVTAGTASGGIFSADVKQK